MKGSRSCHFREVHPLSGKSVVIHTAKFSKSGKCELDGKHFIVEDWVQNMPGGKSWLDCENMAAYKYCGRQLRSNLPEDDEVVYGHIDGLGHMIHNSEL